MSSVVVKQLDPIVIVSKQRSDEKERCFTLRNE